MSGGSRAADTEGRDEPSLRIRAVEFVGAVARPGAPPPERLPQIAFSGRSNVGKSSLINRLLGRTRARVARVSGTPGKTQEINFYRVSAALGDGRDAVFLLVDLPGYGYAKVPEAVRKHWKPLIERYLAGTPELLGVVQILDARHAPSAEDRQMVRYLAETGVPTLFVVTKMDKLRRSERVARIDAVRETLELDPEQVLPFSAKTGEGRPELLASLADLLGGAEAAA